MRCFIQGGAGQFVAAPADVALDVRLARLVAPRRQAEMGTDLARVSKAVRIHAPERKSLTEAAGLSGCAGVKFRRQEALCGDCRGLGDEGRGTVCEGPLRGSD